MRTLYNYSIAHSICKCQILATGIVCKYVIMKSCKCAKDCVFVSFAVDSIRGLCYHEFDKSSLELCKCKIQGGKIKKEESNERSNDKHL